MLRSGAELIGFYLSADRLPVERQWSRRHADTQRYLCERFVAPVIDGLVCQDITVADVQAVVNAAPTAVLGRKVQACASALVGAGIAGGYLASPRLAQVHWQPQGRPLGPVRGAVAGESVLFVDPGEVPGPEDVSVLGKVLAARGWLLELMACFAAYSGLRWGELAALTVGQIDQATRQMVVDRKVVEVRGNRISRRRKAARAAAPSTRRTPAGWPLAEHVARRVAEVVAGQAAGRNLQGLMFPAPGGSHWRSSNFNRRFLQPAYLAAGWRDSDGGGRWTWHSLRHVFCTTALFTWGLDRRRVPPGRDATVRTTLDMYVGSTAGALGRAHRATD